MNDEWSTQIVSCGDIYAPKINKRYHHGAVLLLVWTALVCSACWHVCEWEEMICMTVLECHLTYTVPQRGPALLVEGERDHKVWSLTSVVHTHTQEPPSSPDRWCLALTVCVGVCQGEGQHHQSVRCTQHTVHSHTRSHKLYIFLISIPKASVVTSTTQTTCFVPQGQTVRLHLYELSCPLSEL